mgnify:CR=1 FL=1
MRAEATSLCTVPDARGRRVSVTTALTKTNKILAKIGVKPMEAATEKDLAKAIRAVTTQQGLCEIAIDQIVLLEDAMYERKAEL